MTDANHDYENFDLFIKQRMAALAYNDLANNRESTLQAVTVRLPAGNVALLDFFGKEMDYSRQQIMGHLINLALDQMMVAWADQAPDEKRSEVYRKLQNIRSEE